MPASGSLEQHETDEKDTFFEEKKVEYFWSMSGAKLYMPEEPTFTIPSTHVDVLQCGAGRDGRTCSVLDE